MKQRPVCPAGGIRPLGDPRGVLDAIRRVASLAIPLLLAAYGGAMLLLANAAHLGGLLVHEYGIRAQV